MCRRRNDRDVFVAPLEGALLLDVEVLARALLDLPLTRYRVMHQAPRPPRHLNGVLPCFRGRREGSHRAGVGAFAAEYGNVATAAELVRLGPSQVHHQALPLGLSVREVEPRG